MEIIDVKNTKNERRLVEREQTGTHTTIEIDTRLKYTPKGRRRYLGMRVESDGKYMEHIDDEYWDRHLGDELIPYLRLVMEPVQNMLNERVLLTKEELERRLFDKLMEIPEEEKEKVLEEVKEALTDVIQREEAPPEKAEKERESRQQTL